MDPKTQSMPTIAKGNIIREKLIDLTSSDFTDEFGFFLRSSTGGVVRVVPAGNEDSEAITKTITASPFAIDPTIYRKVFRLITSPDTELYACYGV
jgi:hypothetical protein